MAAVGAVFSVIGFTKSQKAARQQKAASKEQARAQRIQQREQKKLADIKAQRERRKLIREQRIAQAKIAVAAGGDFESSRVQGTAGSVATQAASATAFAGQQQEVAQNIFEAGGVATQASADLASAQAKGQQASAITGLGQTLFDPNVQNLFEG